MTPIGIIIFSILGACLFAFVIGKALKILDDNAPCIPTPDHHYDAIGNVLDNPYNF